MDLKTHDKKGYPLNLQPAASKNTQANYHDWWLDNPDRYEPTPEDIKCELQLQALGDFEQLDFDFDFGKFKKEIKEYDDKWVPYLRREGISNDREALCLVGLEGDEPDSSLSRPEAMRRKNMWLEETDFKTPTKLYKDITSLHEILDYFSPLGRTMLVKVNKGGWFPPHRDNPHLTRDSFRVVVFLGNKTDYDHFEWIQGNKRLPIIPNKAYYVDTKQVHRTHSWADNSYHVILNIPKTWENVIKLMSRLMHY